MTDPEYTGWLTLVRAIRSGDAAVQSPDCLDDESIAALADGSSSADARAAAIPHLATCGACRRAIAAVVRALADPTVGAQVAATSDHRPIRLRVAVASLVGVAALLALFFRPTPEKSTPTHRAPITAASAPEAIAPVGDVPAARALRWHAVPGADRYRITVFDSTGAARYEVVQDSPVVVLPDSVQFVDGAPYWWIVAARVGFDRWTSSRLVPFRVKESGLP